MDITSCAMHKQQLNAIHIFYESMKIIHWFKVTKLDMYIPYVVYEVLYRIIFNYIRYLYNHIYIYELLVLNN